MSQGTFNFDPSQYPGFDWSSLPPELQEGQNNIPYSGGMAALGPNQMGPPVPGQQVVPSGQTAQQPYPGAGQQQGPAAPANMQGQPQQPQAVNPANYLGGQEGSAAGYDQSMMGDGGGGATYGPQAWQQQPNLGQMPSVPGGGNYHDANPNMAAGYYAANAAGQAQNAATQAYQDNQNRLQQIMGMYNTDINQQTPAAYAQMLGLAGANQAYNEAQNTQQENNAVGGTTQRLMSMGLGNSTVLPGMQQQARQPYITNQANISANAANQQLGVLGQQQNALEGEKSQQRNALYNVSNPYPN